MTREQKYEEQLRALGVWEDAFAPLVRDLAKAERRRTRAEKEWSATSPPGGKPSFLDPHYQIVAQLDREILGYREVMGLTPKSLRRLRGVPEAPGERDLITERLDRIAARVSAYDPPDPAEKEAEWDELARMFNLDTGEEDDTSSASLRSAPSPQGEGMRERIATAACALPRNDTSSGAAAPPSPQGDGMSDE